MSQNLADGAVQPKSRKLLDVKSLVLEYLSQQEAVLEVAARATSLSETDFEKQVHTKVSELLPTLDPAAWDAISNFVQTASAVRPSEFGHAEFTALTDELFAQLESLDLGHLFEQDGFWFEIFGLMDHFEHKKPAAPQIYSAMLVTLVANFEAMLGDLARLSLYQNPIQVEPTSTFTWKDILAAGSIEDLREKSIEGYVSSMLHDALPKCVDFFTKRAGVRVPGDVMPPQLREVFLRRNVWVHNRGRASHIYCDSLDSSLPTAPLDDLLEVDLAYLSEAADHLIAATYRLGLAVGNHIYKGDDLGPFKEWATNFPYRLLLAGRHRVVEQITSPELSHIFTANGKLVSQVNNWIAKKHLQVDDSWRSEVEEWDVSTLSATYKLAQLALTDRNEEALELSQRLLRARELDLIFFHTWPLLAGVREHLRQKVESISESHPSDATV